VRNGVEKGVGKMKVGKMKIIAIEDIVASTVLTFCENLAELGCPKDEKNPDMWFRYLSPKEQRKVAEKMLEIEERYISNTIEEEKQIEKKSKKKSKK